jgi:hypothetical protein
MTMTRFLLAVLVASLPIYAACSQEYGLMYSATPDRGQIAFRVSVIASSSGRSIHEAIVRAPFGVAGSTAATHDGRTIRVAMRGERSGEVELTLSVSRGDRIIERNVFRGGLGQASVQSRYLGERIGVHLRDADLRDTLLTLAKISGTSLAIDPGIDGRVTIDLADVPVDQVIQLIAAQHGLVAVRDQGIARVRPLR